MGNCQAIDAATLVIQHPSGKIERFYSPMSANHVMKTNPGHYVALLISTTMCPTKVDTHSNKGTHHTKTNPVRLTRIKLLKPTDPLLLGHVYRLITTQEVMKGLREKKQAKMRQNKTESGHKHDMVKEKVKLGLEIEEPATRVDTQDNMAMKPERQRTRTTTSSNNNSGSVTAKTRFWQPSLQSISELAS